MSALTTFNVPLDHELECPVCHTRLDILAEVDITNGKAQIVGRAGFDATLSVYTDNKIISVTVKEHKCAVKTA